MLIVLWFHGFISVMSVFWIMTRSETQKCVFCIGFWLDVNFIVSYRKLLIDPPNPKSEHWLQEVMNIFTHRVQKQVSPHRCAETHWHMQSRHTLARPFFMGSREMSSNSLYTCSQHVPGQSVCLPLSLSVPFIHMDDQTCLCFSNTKHGLFVWFTIFFLILFLALSLLHLLCHMQRHCWVSPDISFFIVCLLVRWHTTHRGV